MVVLLHAEDHHSPGKLPVSLPSVTRLSDQWPDPWLCVPASRRVCPYRERVSARFELQTSRAARWMPECGPHAEDSLSVSGTNGWPETSGFHPRGECGSQGVLRSPNPARCSPNCHRGARADGGCPAPMRSSAATRCFCRSSPSVEQAAASNYPSGRKGRERGGGRARLTHDGACGHEAEPRSCGQLKVRVRGAPNPIAWIV